MQITALGRRETAFIRVCWLGGLAACLLGLAACSDESKPSPRSGRSDGAASATDLDGAASQSVSEAGLLIPPAVQGGEGGGGAALAPSTPDLDAGYPEEGLEPTPMPLAPDAYLDEPGDPGSPEL